MQPSHRVLAMASSVVDSDIQVISWLLVAAHRYLFVSLATTAERLERLAAVAVATHTAVPTDGSATGATAACAATVVPTRADADARRAALATRHVENKKRNIVSCARLGCSNTAGFLPAVHRGVTGLRRRHHGWLPQPPLGGAGGGGRSGGHCCGHTGGHGICCTGGGAQASELRDG